MEEAASATETASKDDVMDVDPELIDESPSPRIRKGAGSHHPPPPPRWRRRAASPESAAIAIEDSAGRGEPQLARDLMTRSLLTIEPDQIIENVEDHMEAFRFRHLPVVEGDVLVGLISHSDLLHAFSSKLSKSAPEENVIIRSLPASRVMRTELVTVRPDEPLASVAALLWESRAGCVLVTEEDGTLVGIITEGDFVRLGRHFLTARAG